MRTRLIVLLALALSAATAPPAGAQAPSRAFTLAAGTDWGFGPSARLKAWRDDANSRLCFRVSIPFDLRGRRGANRGRRCVPYPVRRALTTRVIAFDPCHVGGRILVVLARADVARVVVLVDRYRPDSLPHEAERFYSPRLTPDGALFHTLLGEDNLIQAVDSEGRELASALYDETLPACPFQGPLEFL